MPTTSKTRSICSASHALLHLLIFSTTILILPNAHAQVGTVTQQVTTLSAFPSQKECARDCFVTTGFCPNDILGSVIGCAPHTDCQDSNWLAKNDCYCRQDLQPVAQSYLTSCVSEGCKVGDVAIDASTAGSIYSQYCVEKGFAVTGPATIQATTTGPGGSSTVTATGVSLEPTSSSTGKSSSSQSHGLSTSAIIGIAVGGLAGLVILSTLLKKLECFGGGKVPHPPQPPFNLQPVYPPNPYHEPYYPKMAGSEITPDDSVSMVSGMPPPAHTLVSAAPAYHPRW
ncbi:hypothetical protein BU16DRAFT_201114 [Lophium mytilinum]|uniref:Extracellular membrane protein CFEM domain-containing protein n=1 Tax=Lophium mytilinum TaxID=390894 RepID=A0A6A6RDI5_9PEZI|nr:hypothetical protein BU16DRAFT_201114 [Lophium mytilinum]